MQARAHVIVSGIVHGVFFRANTKEKADSLGLNGWVRNTPEGKVEAVFEGDKDKIEEVLNFCKTGPSGAVVKDVDVRWEEPKGETGFEIRYE